MTTSSRMSPQTYLNLGVLLLLPIVLTPLVLAHPVNLKQRTSPCSNQKDNYAIKELDAKPRHIRMPPKTRTEGIFRTMRDFPRNAMKGIFHMVHHGMGSLPSKAMRSMSHMAHHGMNGMPGKMIKSIADIPHHGMRVFRQAGRGMAKGFHSLGRRMMNMLRINNGNSNFSKTLATNNDDVDGLNFINDFIPSQQLSHPRHSTYHGRDLLQNLQNSFRAQYGPVVEAIPYKIRSIPNRIRKKFHSIAHTGRAFNRGLLTTGRSFMQIFKDLFAPRHHYQANNNQIAG